MSDNAPLSVQDQARMRLKELQESRDPRGSLLPPATDAKKEIRPISGKPKKKKFGQKLKEAMFSEDIGNGSVTEYVFFKVMIPAVKQVISNMANTAINMALGLDPKTRTINVNTHTANASQYAQANRDRNFAGNGNYGYSRHREAVSDYTWTREDAEDIYNQCVDILEHYPSLSLANVYSIMNMAEKIQSTDEHWGWTDPRCIDLVQVDPTDDVWRLAFTKIHPI